MKLTKRIIAGILAICTAFSVAGCKKDDDKKDDGAVPLNELQQEAVNQLAASDVLPELTLENPTITWFGHYSINPKDGKSASPDIYLFEKKYGGKIAEIVSDWAGRYDNLAKAVMSDNRPDFFQVDDMDGYPKGANKMFYPIDDYIDFDSDLWKDVKNTADAFVFNDEHFVATIQVTPAFACVYNTATIAENGLDDPAELFAKGEWTLDKFMEMCKAFVDTSQDKYALDGFWYYDAIQQTTGIPMVGLEDGKIVNNMGSAEIASVENKMYDLQKDKVVFPRAENNWGTRGTGEPGEGVGDGKTLFVPIGLYALEEPKTKTKYFGDIDKEEIMFVPMPDNIDNVPYYTSAKINGYLLCKEAPNPEGFAAFMNCKRACALDEKVTQIGVDQLKENYGWNDEMIAMRDTLYKMANENPVYEFHQGVTDEIATYFANSICSGTMMENGEGATKSWTEVIGEFKTTLDYLIKEANLKLTTIQSE